MKNYEIDFEKLTSKEAQVILDRIVDIFTVYASGNDYMGWNEVLGLSIMSELQD